MKDQDIKIFWATDDDQPRLSLWRTRSHPSRAVRFLRAVVGLFVLTTSLAYLSCKHGILLNGNTSRNSIKNPAYLIEAEHGAVASENQRCSIIGVQVLKDGGNAVDAAVATTLCTGVVNMFS